MEPWDWNNKFEIFKQIGKSDYCVFACKLHYSSCFCEECIVLSSEIVLASFLIGSIFSASQVFLQILSLHRFNKLFLYLRSFARLFFYLNLANHSIIAVPLLRNCIVIAKTIWCKKCAILIFRWWQGNQGSCSYSRQRYLESITWKRLRLV